MKLISLAASVLLGILMLYGLLWLADIVLLNR